MKLRDCQEIAFTQLEQSFKADYPRVLIQIATGAKKTYTAITAMCRLLKFENAKCILFLVDTKNLGEQVEQEMMSYVPLDDNRKFTELYTVQRLKSSVVATDCQVCTSTIQRLYSILKDKELDECHLSIYNLWLQVLDYFDASLVGLTATSELKKKPLCFDDLQDFIACYNPLSCHQRQETWNEHNAEGRWCKHSFEQIMARDKTNLDIFWIKDKSLSDLDNLPEPDELVNEIIENLEAGLNSFRDIAATLSK